MVLTLKKITYFILFSMLFIPALSFLPIKLNLSKDITFYYRILFWAYGTFFIVQNRINHKKIIFPKMLVFLLLYIFYLFIWSFFNGEMNRRGLLKIIVNNNQLSTLFTILIIYNTKFSDKFINIVEKIIWNTIIITAMVSVIQIFKPTFISANFYDVTSLVSQDIYSLRRTSIFGYVPLGYGLSFIPLLSCFVGFKFIQEKKLPFLFLILGGISVLLTNTRFIMISFVLLSMQFWVIYRERLTKLIKNIVVVVVLFSIMIYVLTYFGYNLSDWFQERLFNEGSIEETTRYKAIGNFMIFFPKYYLVGNGVGLSEDIEAASNAVGSSQIHVGYLAHLVYWGLVGSFLLFGFWFQVILRFYRNAKKTAYWGSFFAFLTFLWGEATFVHFSIFHYGLIFAFVFDKYFMDKYNNRLKNE